MILKKIKTTFSKKVMLPSIIILLTLSILCGLFPQKANLFLNSIQNWFYENLSWAYVLVVTVIFIFLIVLAFSRVGNIRLGEDTSKPQYSFFSWISMLFAAGMGIGLMYFGVAEPISHYIHPVAANTISRAKDAQLYTFLHWGFHAWAIYALIGLVLAYFSFRYKLPLAIRSGLFPIFKDKINGTAGDIVDIFALCCTFFGIATSLGFGVIQLNTGLTYLGILPDSSITWQTVIVIIVIGLAVLSSISGVNKGVKRLSEANMWMAIILMLFVLVLGPTRHLLGALIEGIGNYFTNIVGLTMDTYAFEPEGKPMLTNWTVMYWAWWISWSPFVGLFIARISKGRTIREYILAVIIVPSLFIFMWMTVFGNGAIWIDKNVAGGALSAIGDKPDILLFKFLEYFPLKSVLIVLSLLVIAIFFVTSADSGIIVMNSIASGDKPGSPKWQKIFWGAMLCVISLSLLRIGGLKALQTMTLVFALPFAITMLVLCYCLMKALRLDIKFHNARLPYGSASWNARGWKGLLDKITSFSGKKDIIYYMNNVVTPAFNELSSAFEEKGITSRIESGKKDNIPYMELIIPHDKIRNFKYGVTSLSQNISEYIQSEENTPDAEHEKSYIPVSYFNDGRRGNDLEYLDKDDLIADILKEYERFINIVSDESSRLLVLDKKTLF